VCSFFRHFALRFWNHTCNGDVVDENLKKYNVQLIFLMLIAESLFIKNYMVSSLRKVDALSLFRQHQSILTTIRLTLY